MMTFLKNYPTLIVIIISGFLVSCLPVTKELQIAEINNESNLPKAYELALKNESAPWKIIADVEVLNVASGDHNILFLEVVNIGRSRIRYFDESAGEIDYIESGENCVVKVFPMKDTLSRFSVSLVNEEQEPIEISLLVRTSEPIISERISLKAVMVDGL